MKAPPGWLKGKCEGNFGLFPENYVEKITEEEAKKAGQVVSPEEKVPDVSVKSLVAAISQQLGGGSESADVHPARQTTAAVTSTTTNTTTIDVSMIPGLSCSFMVAPSIHEGCIVYCAFMNVY